MSNKVGFLAFLGSNYGTVLQSFALFQAIKKSGYECEVIGANEFRNRPIPDPNVLGIHSKAYDTERTHITFEKFIAQWFKFNEVLDNIPANALLTSTQEAELNNFSAFICGSDQIWKPAMFWFCAKRYLQFAPEEKRIGYAPSVGWNKIEFGAINNIPQWREWLCGVRYLSTRETTGSAIVAQITGRPVSTVLDPTFLLLPEDWNNLLPYGVVSDEIHKTLISGKPYILAYLLDTYDSNGDYVRKLAERLGLEIIWLTGRDNVGPVQRNCTETDPAGFVHLIKNASFICTDGFHGTCFSLNFSKPFALLSKKENKGNDSRMQDLMQRLGVTGRIVHSGDSPNIISPIMDYDPIRKNINRERDYSLKFLAEALEGASKGRGALFKELKKITGKVTRYIYDNKAVPCPLRTINRVPLDNPDTCTGCGACMNICPVDAIQMLPDENGFRVPVVNDEKCIRCEKCLHNCPLRKTPKLFLREKLTKAYAAWALNPFILCRSTSGGMFPLIASWIFEQGGVAYGVAWDDLFNAKTVCATNMEELKPLSGSKYVQADTGITFREVKKKLEAGIPVLYSGTSCQIGGLYGYLGEDHELLITVDLLCGGTPSPMVLRKYLDWRERQFNSKVIGLEFRSKRVKGWGLGMVLQLQNGKCFEFPMQYDEYGILYNQHFIQRPGCFVCRYRGIDKRWADITIGDFWGIGRHGEAFDYEKSQGISVVLPNSIKGRILFQSISADTKRIFTQQRKLEEVYPGNAWLTKNYGKRKDYNYLYYLLREREFDDAFNEYFGNEDIRMFLKLK